MTDSGRKALRVVTALGAGAAVPFAFAPYSYYVLAFVCLAIWLRLLRDCSLRGALVLSYVFGLGMFGAGVWWVQVSVHQFGLPLYSFSVTVTAFFVAFIALYPVLVGWLTTRWQDSPRPLAMLVLFPAAWTLSEILRGALFTGFPWLLLGYSQIDSPLAVLAPIFGAYGVSFMVALMAGALVLLLDGEQRSRIASVAFVLAIGLGLVVLRDISWTEASGEAESVALVQGAVPQAVKWSRAYRQPSIDLYTELSSPHWGSTFIVWPETAIPAFAEDVPESIEDLSTLARRHRTSLFVGMPSGDPTMQSDYFNSLVLLGSPGGRYDKRHLVPFGEYLPFDRWLRPLLDFLRIPMSSFSRGAIEQAAIVANGIAVGISICYEDAYAGEVARALPTANVLINISNDAWFGDSIAPHQHLQIARMRALETGRYLLRATNTGISAIIDDRGKLLASSKQFVPDVVTGEFIPRRGATPGVTFGFKLVFVVCILICAAGLMPRGWFRRGRR